MVHITMKQSICLSFVLFHYLPLNIDFHSHTTPLSNYLPQPKILSLDSNSIHLFCSRLPFPPSVSYTVNVSALLLSFPFNLEILITLLPSFSQKLTPKLNYTSCQTLHVKSPGSLFLGKILSNNHVDSKG